MSSAEVGARRALARSVERVARRVVVQSERGEAEPRKADGELEERRMGAQVLAPERWAQHDETAGRDLGQVQGTEEG